MKKISNTTLIIGLFVFFIIGMIIGYISFIAYFNSEHSCKYKISHSKEDQFCIVTIEKCEFSSSSEAKCIISNKTRIACEEAKQICSGKVSCSCSETYDVGWLK